MIINISDYPNFEFWEQTKKSPSHIALVYVVLRGVRSVTEFHLFRETQLYYIDVFGIKFKKSDGLAIDDDPHGKSVGNSVGNSVGIDLSTVTKISYFKPSHSSSRGL